MLRQSSGRDFEGRFDGGGIGDVEREGVDGGGAGLEELRLERFEEVETAGAEQELCALTREGEG